MLLCHNPDDDHEFKKDENNFSMNGATSLLSYYETHSQCISRRCLPPNNLPNLNVLEELYAFFFK